VLAQAFFRSERSRRQQCRQNEAEHQATDNLEDRRFHRVPSFSLTATKITLLIGAVEVEPLGVACTVEAATSIRRTTTDLMRRRC